MRKMLIILVGCLSLYAEGIIVGLKVGLNISNLYGTDVGTDTDVYTKMGFCGGGFFGYAFNKVVSIQNEFLFAMKGAKEKGRFYDEYWEDWVDYRGTISINYIEFSPSMRFSVPTETAIFPYFFFGPSLGIKLNGEGRYRFEYEYWGFVDSGSGSLDNVKDTDFGFVLGGGINLMGVIIEIRYVGGMTTIAEGGEDIKNSVFSLITGYSFVF